MKLRSVSCEGLFDGLHIGKAEVPPAPPPTPVPTGPPPQGLQTSGLITQMGSPMKTPSPPPPPLRPISKSGGPSSTASYTGPHGSPAPGATDLGIDHADGVTNETAVTDFLSVGTHRIVVVQ